MKLNDQKVFGMFILCIILLGLFVAVDRVRIDITKFFQSKEAPQRLDYVPQFVLLSFDGSKSVDTWRQTRAFEDEMKASSTPLQFTYFINAAYFLTPDKADLYQAPGEVRGHSNIGFSEDRKNLGERIDEVNKAILDGDEIASHTAGHFWGATWSKSEWEQEFDSFGALLFGTEKNYPQENFPKLVLKPSDIVGFRAPALSIGAGLYQALFDRHFSYDSSEVGDGRSWPAKDAEGLWHIPLGRIMLDHNSSPVIAMDYNVWAHDSQNENTIVRGTLEWNKRYQDASAAYFSYFEKNYTGNRAPVLIGYHFEDWNDGLYWDVFKDFARKICSKPQVRCTTFRDLVAYMNEYGVPAGVPQLPPASLAKPLQDGDEAN